MQDLGPATDDQVILAWLQAENKSPRFKNKVVADAATIAAIREAAENPACAPVPTSRQTLLRTLRDPSCSRWDHLPAGPLDSDAAQMM